MSKTSRRAGVRVSSTRPSAGSTAPTSGVTRRTQSAQQPTKPRTAYELLQRVCEHILEEPKRYYQEAWAIQRRDRIEQLMGEVPACGTIACRAGWIVALHDGLHSKAIKAAGNGSFAVKFRADEILGMSSADTEPLFSGLAIDHECRRYSRYPGYGTTAYARLGVRGLRAFMRTHAAHLKARLLQGGPV